MWKLNEPNRADDLYHDEYEFFYTWLNVER